MSSFIPDPADLSVFLLAGGNSSRMGFNKAFAPLGGVPLLTRVATRIGRFQKHPVALNADIDLPNASGLRLVPDVVSGKLGPLAGVLTAMRDTAKGRPDATHVMTVPVDSPFFPTDLVSRLAASIEYTDEIAIPLSGGRDHPVFGLWPVGIADDLEAWLLHDDKRRMRDFFARHKVKMVEFAMIETARGALDPFFNINRPDDLVAAEGWFEAIEQISSAAIPKVFGIAGWKNSGKTGLTVRLVTELTRRGYKVSTIKHAHHDFDIDKVGADSYRHREAGAHEVTIVSGTRYAIMHELRGAPQPGFEEILARLAPCDLVLIEGYKHEPIPKIETRRTAAVNREPLAAQDPHIVAIAADHPVVDAGSLAVFDLDDTITIADFIATTVGLSKSP